MKFLSVSKDGGEESTVWAYWLLECKWLLSIALLCFENGSREAYHSHAFSCISWVLSGSLIERHRNGKTNLYFPSLRPVFTYRSTFHKVTSVGRTWVITFRGPWSKEWREYLPAEGREVTLTHGRKEVV